MARDIDYAAIAVKKAIVEKFGHKSDLQNLEVSANEKSILIDDGPLAAEGTRDDLLAVVRASDTYDMLWEKLPMRDRD